MEEHKGQGPGCAGRDMGEEAERVPGLRGALKSHLGPADGEQAEAGAGRKKGQGAESL